MGGPQLYFFSVAGLRFQDVDPATTPTLYAWANSGVLAELTPSFPCVTSSVQASMWTGVPPRRHGIIGNGFFHRDRNEVAFWVARNEAIEAEQIWDMIPQASPGLTSAVWHAQNIKDARADYIVTPEPIHDPDGSMKLWCYSKPDGLYQQLVDQLGHFPLQHYWGPQANIESTQWILRGALWLAQTHAPNFHWIYLPHLDYAAQKFGPNSAEAKTALVALDQQLSTFRDAIESLGRAIRPQYMVAGEYALTDVHTAIFPNRLLRQAGLLRVEEKGGHEYLDLGRSAAFAMVDHQFAHVFIRDDRSKDIMKAKALFENEPGIDAVYAGQEREAVGLGHARSGDIILVTKDTHWLAYYWWLDDRAAPPFARTVDIHSKPGYDPLELFFDPVTKSISLDTARIRGSHGVPATGSRHRTALISSLRTEAIEQGKIYRDTDMKSIVLKQLTD